MLLELVVENFAVVEQLRLALHPGLNVLTGETGSGKSLVVDALALLLGGRATTDLIRTGAERAFVSGRFELTPEPALRALLDEAGLAGEDGELLIEREILAGGKSRAYAANRPVTTALLRQLAPFLGDIHGQHDQQMLLSGDAQRELLDTAALDQAELARVQAAWDEWSGAVAELAELDRIEKDKLRLADLWTMQLNEIDPLAVRAGEDAALDAESRVLGNVARLTENVTAAYDALSEAENSASKNVALALKRLDELIRIDAKIAGVVELLEPARIAIHEAAHELRHYLGALEADPVRLESIQTRMAQLGKLKRKYGATIEEILAFADELRAKLSAVAHAGERREELRQRIAQLDGVYQKAAARLSQTRERAAGVLRKAVERELNELAMSGAAFRVALRAAAPARHGIDAVEFLFSANAGEEPRALDRVASGGELSRVALALKTCLTARAASPGRGRTLVFDEVDSGVGGAAAELIGRRLKRIAQADQVLCVTHLAQIASYGDHHYSVEKRATLGRVATVVRELKPEQRIRELGRMLSGERLSDEALRHAARLLEESARAGQT
jgi:DNA repair protein RecN (Recombination protein N)